MKFHFLENFILTVLTFVLLFATLYIPVTVYTLDDLSQVKLGLPFSFIVQAQSKSPPLPWQTAIAGFYENPTKVLWLPFFADFLIVFALLKVISKILKSLD